MLAVKCVNVAITQLLIDSGATTSLSYDGCEWEIFI